MIAFPVLKSLTVEKYGLYPASLGGSFTAAFEPGPNLVVGVNGSGKTTLIMMGLRCITGPNDLPSASSESEFGQVRPRPRGLSKPERQVFARRVADGARVALATLAFSLGKKTIEITRDLSDLSLREFRVSGKKVDCLPVEKDQDEEDVYQERIAELFGVGAFFDVLIILRFLVFMLEDRRALVWDPTAQRQIFRVLLLSPDRAGEYASAQQAIISADSAVRNTRNAIYRQKNELDSVAKNTKVISAIEAERRAKSAESLGVRERLESVAKARVDADDTRRAARLARLKAAEDRDSSVRELERIKMEALRHWLGPSKDTVRYVVGHLLADRRCLVCNTDSVSAAEAIEDRLRKGLCPVCGSKHDLNEDVVPLAEADRVRIQRLESKIGLADKQIADGETRIAEAITAFEAADEEYDKLETNSIALDREILKLTQKLPADRAAAATGYEDIEALQRILATDERKLKTAESRFRIVNSESLGRVQQLQDEIAKSFGKYLQLFLKEKAALVYQTISNRVGQGGAVFDFPAFRLALGGGAVTGETIREDPDSVSQSQAEFVDLAFRMSLMSVVADGEAASLVVDAPEASLDFLFAERAGHQLAAFSTSHPDNRVIITSYLPSKHLVLTFLKGIKGERKRRERIVDLIRHAAPNAALRADRDKYEEFLQGVIKGEA
jgi:AAA domain-containing protein